MNRKPRVQGMIEGLLGRITMRVIYRKTVRRVYRSFARQNPELAAALFDEHFLDHAAQPIIKAFCEASSLVGPASLAAAWADQLRSTPSRRGERIAEVTPLAAEFLYRVRAELRSQGALIEAKTQPA